MNKVLDILSWLGSLLLAFCALPEVYRSLTEQNYTTSLLFMWMWLLGEIFLLFNSLVRLRQEKYLIANYSLNILFITIILIRAS